MQIAFVAPDGLGHENRTFECALCNQSTTVRVKYR
jgi:hypothetical protein